MSWIDNLITDFVIRTGDNRKYTPLSLWLSYNRHVDYNIAEFNFKNTDGTLVIRGTPKGMQYNLELIFQGADNLDIARDFINSANNKGAWTITHPFYGSLYVQPIALTQDNGKLNQSVFTGQVIQTITEDGTEVVNSAPDAVAAAAVIVSQHYNDTYAAAVPVMHVSDIQALQNHINASYTAVMAKINGVQDDVTQYNNLFSAASSILNPVLYDTIQILSAAKDLYNAPATFVDTVANRLKMYEAQLINFGLDVAAILGIGTGPTRSLKKLYENNAGIAISAMCLASVTNVTTDYDYRPGVLGIISTIIKAYNGYILNLYTLQTLNGGQIDSYIPDATAVTSLSQIVKYTTSALFNLASGAKQERTLIVPYDTNVILLADELYGMLPDDSTITSLIANNNIGIDELFVIKQGRKIVYYV